MKSRKTTHKKSAGGTLIGMFIGLVLGVCIAAGVVWYINKAPLPFNQNVQNGDTRPASATTSQEPKALPGKPGDPAMEKRFQFYDILPGKADAVPEKAATTTPADKPESKPEAKAGKESRSPLFLQAGSFSNAEDADNQKVKLAFMGIESTVQQVMIEDRTWYRVRIGPYFQLEELNKTRASLAKSGIEAQLSK
ncbi:SPOR domain-containing protein [Azonexus hydrophilus]|uniref:SPOR domain-containing protein n=1 Tax=Azonexus hydrophilus TaxID=418702 RepID=UPI001F069761|nr:SPOR domain-containing protein [Azonexus hydrophilus]MDX9737702.1 SPOR domain-containing protein [Azonexus sp.]